MTKKYRLFKACKDFSVIQLSNYRVSKANHDALPQVIRNLKKEGYTFGSLYDLLEVNAKDVQK